MYKKIILFDVDGVVESLSEIVNNLLTIAIGGAETNV
jgi:hypothetical protein